MKNFINRVTSLINCGNKIDQSITINNIETGVTQLYLKSIKENFYRGNIKESFKELNDLYIYNSDKEVKSKILICKAWFFLELNKIDDLKSTIEFIENNLYVDNSSVKELKLNIYLIDKNKEKYLELVDQLNIEVNLDKNYAKLLYLLIEDDFQTFEIEIKKYNKTNIKDYEKLLWHSVFSKKIDYLNKEINVNFDMIDKEIKKLSDKNIIGSINLYTQFLIIPINLFLQRRKIDKFIYYFQNAEKHFDILITQLNEFEVKRRKSILEIHLFLKIILKKEDEFLEISDKNIGDMTDILLIEYSRKAKKENILLTIKDKLIYQVDFITKLLDENKNKEIIDHIINYYTDDIPENIKYFYYIAKINLKDKNVINDLKKENQFYFNILYLEATLKLNTLYNEDIILIRFKENVKATFLTYFFLLKVLEILKQLKEYDMYIFLVNKYLNIYDYIIDKSLDLLIKDKDLTFNFIEKYISEFEGVIPKKNNIRISELFLLFGSRSKYIEYMNKSWDEEKSITLSRNLLSVILKNNLEGKYSVEMNKAYNFLDENKENLDIEESIIYAIFSLKLKRYNSIICLNNIILDNHNNLGEKELKLLENLYILFLNEKKLNITIKQNEVITLKNKTYYSKYYDIPSEIRDTYNMYPVETAQLFIYSRKKGASSNYLILILLGYLKNYFNGIKEIHGNTTEETIENIKKQLKALNSEKLMENYMSKDIGSSMYSFSQNEYYKYPAIFDLLFQEKKGFFVKKENYKTKKILTISSIIFLKSINKLNGIKKLHNIYIQQSVIDYIEDLCRNTEKKVHKMSINYDQTTDSLVIIELKKKDISSIEKYWFSIYEFILAFPKENILSDEEIIKPFRLDDDTENNLINNLGILAYKALFLSITNDYQLITEDKALYFMLKNIHTAIKPINSTFLLMLNFNDYENLLTFNDLLNKGYKNIYYEKHIKNLTFKLLMEQSLNLVINFNSDLKNYIEFMEEYPLKKEFLERINPIYFVNIDYANYESNLYYKNYFLLLDLLKN